MTNTDTASQFEIARTFDRGQIQADIVRHDGCDHANLRPNRIECDHATAIHEDNRRTGDAIGKMAAAEAEAHVVNYWVDMLAAYSWVPRSAILRITTNSRPDQVPDIADNLRASGSMSDRDQRRDDAQGDAIREEIDRAVKAAIAVEAAGGMSDHQRHVTGWFDRCDAAYDRVKVATRLAARAGVRDVTAADAWWLAQDWDDALAEQATRRHRTLARFA